MQQSATATEAVSSQAKPQPADPNEAARRELVAWCERHGLPVPVERREPRG